MSQYSLAGHTASARALAEGGRSRPADFAAESSYVGVGDAISALWRRKWTLAASIGAGAVLALALAFSQARMYQARTTVEVQMPNEDYLGRRQLNPVVEPGTMLLEPFLQTQLKLVQADTLLLTVVDRNHWAQHPALNPPPGMVAKLTARIAGGTPLAPTR